MKMLKYESKVMKIRESFPQVIFTKLEYSRWDKRESEFIGLYKLGCIINNFARKHKFPTTDWWKLTTWNSRHLKSFIIYKYYITYIYTL